MNQLIYWKLLTRNQPEMLMIFTATSEHLCDVLMFDPENVRSEHNDHSSQVTIDLRLDKKIR